MQLDPMSQPNESSRIASFQATRLALYQPRAFSGARRFGDLTQRISTTNENGEHSNQAWVYAGLSFGIMGQGPQLQVICSTPSMLRAADLLGLEIKHTPLAVVEQIPVELYLVVDGSRTKFAGVTAHGWTAAGATIESQDVWVVGKDWNLDGEVLEKVTDLSPYDEGWRLELSRRRR